MWNRIKTKPIKKSSVLNDVHLHLPDTWNELSKKQLLRITKLLNKKVRKTVLEILVFLELTGTVIQKNKRVFRLDHSVGFFFTKKTGFGKLNQPFLLYPDEMAWMLKRVEKFFDTVDLTKNKLPSLRNVFHRYYGPQENMFTSTLAEWVHAEFNYSMYAKTGKKEFLNKLVAVLYRRKAKNYNPNSPEATGDKREKFNEFTFERRAKRLRFVPKHKKTAVFMFYTGIRNHLQNAHPKTFGGSGDQTSDLGKSLQSMVRSLNEGDPLRNEKLLATNVHDVLTEIESALKQQEKLNKKMKS